MTKRISFKWMVSSVFVTLFILMGNLASANLIDEAIKLEKRTDKMFSLSVSLEEAVDFRIKMRDAYNYELHKEILRGTKSYKKAYDMRQLPSGEYFLEIEDEQKIYEWTILIEDQNMSIVKTSEIIIPDFKRNADRVELKLANYASIKIVDDTGIELYNEEITQKQPVKRVFDFSQVPRGNYLIVTKVGDRKFRYFVND